MTEFDEHFRDDAIAAFRDKVRMALDPEVDQAYPVRWIGKVTVRTVTGEILRGRVEEPKGDPGNSLSRPELEEKALRLARYADAATDAEMRAVIARIWGLARADHIGRMLP